MRPLRANLTLQHERCHFNGDTGLGSYNGMTCKHSFFYSYTPFIKGVRLYLTAYYPVTGTVLLSLAELSQDQCKRCGLLVKPFLWSGV